MGCVSSKKATSFRELPSFTPKSCLNCKQPYAHRGWCKPCVIKRFKSDFANWTSGNLELDNYIRYTQLNITNSSSFLEWIPYDKFDDVREMYKGGFGIVCSAIWDLGPKLFWDDGAENWVREGEKRIALKRLQNSRNADPEFWKELQRNRLQSDYVLRCYGFTRDPISKDYFMITELVDGDLRHYLRMNYKDISWEKKLGIVYNIAHGLMEIHNANLLHKNFHSGNILRHFNGSQSLTFISDLGQYYPADNPNIDENHAYGILPYVAPEILCGEDYTEASDVYSFGIVMWEVASSQKPFFDRIHDEQLAREICDGLRPPIILEIPQCYIELMNKCWDADSKLRPNIREIEKILMSWGWHMGVSQKHIVSNQFFVAEKVRLQLLKPDDSNLKPFTTPHPQAIYKSRLLDFENLPTPRNLNDLKESDQEHSFYDNGSNDDNDINS